MGVCPDGDADPPCGNHNWVEVWTGGAWSFVDEDTSNPLNKSWFFPADTNDQVPGSRNHSIYASSWKSTGNWYPMVWDWSNHHVPSIERTKWYHEIAPMQ